MTTITVHHLAPRIVRLLDALREIAEGCIARQPGHVDYGKNRTKAQIEAIARSAIAREIAT